MIKTVLIPDDRTGIVPSLVVGNKRTFFQEGTVYGFYLVDWFNKMRMYF